jgi:hypothetical protein
MDRLAPALPVVGLSLRVCNGMRHLTFIPALSPQLRGSQSDFLVCVLNVSRPLSWGNENSESFAFSEPYVKKLLKCPEHFGCQVTETDPGRLKKIKAYADKVDVYFDHAQLSGF